MKDRLAQIAEYNCKGAAKLVVVKRESVMHDGFEFPLAPFNQVECEKVIVSSNLIFSINGEVPLGAISTFPHI